MRDDLVQAPPAARPLNDLEGHAHVRRKFFATRRRHYLRLNGAVVSVLNSPTSHIEWEVSVLHAQIEQTPRRTSLIITLATGTRLYLHLEDRTQHTTWYHALQSASRHIFEADYRLREEIGEGAFATVHRATHVASGTTVAVKRIKKTDFDLVTARELDREMYAMRNLRHANILTAHAVYNTLHDVHIVMDYMRGGTLKDNVQAAGGRISESHARAVMLQVLTACDFLHGLGFVHRDLKLENVLCDTTNFPIRRVRLADFGYVNFVDHAHHICLRSLLGTPVYIAPEIISRKPYGPSVDVYAAGVMLYRMVSGHYPYDGRDDDDRTFDLAVEARLRFPDAAWRKVSRKCRSFVRALLQPKPNVRLTARTALLHPWLCGDGDASACDDGGGFRGGVDAARLAADFLAGGLQSVENGIPMSPVTPVPMPSDDGEQGNVEDERDWAHADGAEFAGTIDTGDSRRYVRNVRREGVKWSAAAERTRAKVRKIAWAIAFARKIGVVSGVWRMAGFAMAVAEEPFRPRRGRRGGGDEAWSALRKMDTERFEMEGVDGLDLGSGDTGGGDPWRAGEVHKDRRRRSQRRSSFATLTGRLGRAASFTRPDGSSRFGTLGDTLKRTVSLRR